MLSFHMLVKELPNEHEINEVKSSAVNGYPGVLMQLLYRESALIVLCCLQKKAETEFMNVQFR
jgi:hypothetical protein